MTAAVIDIKARLKALKEERAAARADSVKILEEARTPGDDGGAPAGLTGDLLARFENSDEVVGRTSVEINALEEQLAAERADAEFVENR